MNPVPEEVDESLAKAKRLVLAMFSQDRQPSPKEVDNAVTVIFGMLAGQGEVLDRDRLAKEIEQVTAVFQEGSSGLDDGDTTKHEPWLPEAKNDRDWEFWERYRRYLEDVRNLPPAVVRRLDQSTDEVLSQLEDPRREGSWRRTGLVIGQVQSGKTGQYIGLASKAVDAGYQLVVILAGIHNDLRSQTQLRVDEGLLGFDSQHQQRSNEAGSRMGAGRMPGAKRLDIASPTNSSEKGDFGRSAANAFNSVRLGHFPVVLVVKKHWKILEYLRNWVKEVKGTEDETGRTVIRDIPLFVIDDEADNASVNTKRDPEADPTRTNGAIRELMRTFDKSAYVGYTATPFANIYIDPDVEHPTFGADLFPDSFIRALPSPSNYLGPERVFGLQVDDEDEEDVAPLPLLRSVNDAERWIPSKHKSSFVPSDDLPLSLREAIASFVLACAARKARGQARMHNSMLVHVTRFTAVQRIVHDQVFDYLGFLKDSLRDRHGQASQQTTAEFRTLWERDFVPTTDQFPTGEVEPLSWEEVSEHVQSALRKIVVRTVNGASRDALEYYEHRRNGFWVIAIGGQKLSRGLTLEGLTVSYYLRTSNTYDTLLQMGRWFGYRPGYEDLCRLYTTPALQAKYVEVTAATDELRREVEEMAALDLTPSQFGFKVRASSLGLTITAPNKMRQGIPVRLSYSGEGPETTLFNLSKRVRENNLKLLEDLVRRMDSTSAPEPEALGGSVIWTGVPREAVSEFLSKYVTDSMAARVRPRFIAKYIDKCANVNELSEWTVRLVGKAATEETQEVANRKIGPVSRAPINDPGYKTDGRYIIRRLVSPKDEQTGLDPDQVSTALENTQKAAEKKKKVKVPRAPSGEHLRHQRRPDQALLLIYLVDLAEREISAQHPPLVGFQVNFPRSEHQAETEYVVNSIWKQEGLDDDVDDEEDSE
ncbi:Z1 domain-containing protein [Streptomyces sp. NPDC093707]|uniref:Z1 domain-containing protein n=1 Tax=Streptomyces sp. NPDC093707 TaxID=3154984 RepID=UPI00344C10AB